MSALKMEGIVKWRGLKSQGPLYSYCAIYTALYKFSWLATMAKRFLLAANNFVSHEICLSKTLTIFNWDKKTLNKMHFSICLICC